MDIKAEPLGLVVPDPDVAAPAQGRGLSWQSLWVEPEWGAPDSLVMFLGPCDGPSHLGSAQGWGQPHCLLIASFSESSFLPICPPGLGDQVGSCPVLPHRAIRGLGPRSSQGWALEAPGRRVPLPSAVHTRSLVGGTPKPFWEGLQRKVQPRPPQGWQPPTPAPGPP